MWGRGIEKIQLTQQLLKYWSKHSLQVYYITLGGTSTDYGLTLLPIWIPICYFYLINCHYCCFIRNGESFIVSEVNPSLLLPTRCYTGRGNRPYDGKHHVKNTNKVHYHLIVFISSSITNTRLSMLTSPKYFTTQRQMWRHILENYAKS